jgi:hypothetical protein
MSMPLPFPDPPLADEVVRVRRWSAADVPAIATAVKDPLIPHHTRIPADQSEDDVRLWLAARELGYWLGPWARGRGVATRAVKLLARWSFEQLGLERLALHTSSDNLASQAVAGRAGFTREGVLRSWEERHGERADIVVFSQISRDPRDLGQLAS